MCLRERNFIGLFSIILSEQKEKEENKIYQNQKKKTKESKNKLLTVVIWEEKSPIAREHNTILVN